MKGCFTFNERRMIAQVPSLRNLSEAELEDLLKNRLELVLDPQVHEYLPSTSEVGFLVLIKNPGTSPSPPSDAVFVPPGYTTYIGLTLVNNTTDTSEGGLSKIVVYFATARFDNIRSAPKYDGLHAFSAIGSVNGMYLGLSFLVIIEMIELLVAGCSRSRGRP
ncbi:hypothetical protein V5799_001157 [Amblyomma americanum]|uniref:Uncharacterized protein n=1 Tax=Amblyomma americanum TaxID=6943 RepID=A0AAQ4D0Z7_AMBAM